MPIVLGVPIAPALWSRLEEVVGDQHLAARGFELGDGLLEFGSVHAPNR